MEDTTTNSSRNLRLPLWLVTPIVLLVFVGVATWWSFRAGQRQAAENVRDEMVRDMIWTAARLDAISERAFRLSDREAIQEEMAALGANRDFTFAVVTDETYAVLQSMRRADIGKQLDQVLPAEYQEVALVQPASLTHLRERLGGQVQPAGDGRSVIAAYPVVLGRRNGEVRPNRVGSLVLVSDYSFNKSNSSRVVTREAFVFFSLTSLVAMGLGVFFHFAIARRLRRLARVAESFGTGNTLRTRIHGNDEVASLARSIDQMMAQKVAAAAELVDSEERYRGLFESTHDLVQSVSMEGRFLFVNPEWKKALGYSDDDLSRMTVFDVIHPDSLEHCQSLFQKLMSGESVRCLEAIFVAKDGRQVVVEGNATPRLADGKVVATHGFFRDITERQAEQSILKERQSQLQSILNTAVEGIITIDDQGAIESLNPSAETLFGYTTEELVGRNVKMLMPAPFHDEHDGYLSHYRETGEKKIIGIGREVVGRRKDGTTFPMELAVSEIKLADRRIFTGFVRDLTERRRSEEIEQSLGRIVDDSLNEIFIFDAETLNFVQVNRGACENLGYSLKEMRTLTPLSIKPFHTEQSFEELVNPLRNEELEQVIFETKHRRKDGTDYDVEIHLQMAQFQGKSCFVAIVVDITERIEAAAAIARLNDELEQRVEDRTRQLQEVQEQLVRKEKLATLGQLAGGVAHEIRNPLGVIRNAVYFLQQVQGDEDVKDALDEISRGLMNSERIVSELLDYARGSAPEVTLFPLDEAINAALEMVRMPGNVSATGPEAASIHINADRGQIERLLANLIQNATQAMPEGGALTIRCNAVDGKVVTEVCDTGTGIAPEDLTKIFEPLFTSRAKGIGLGLPLCVRYAEQNGGTLTAESESGKGSTFTVTLPAAAQDGECS